MTYFVRFIVFENTKLATLIVIKFNLKITHAMPKYYGCCPDGLKKPEKFHQLQSFFSFFLPCYWRVVGLGSVMRQNSADQSHGLVLWQREMSRQSAGVIIWLSILSSQSERGKIWVTPKHFAKNENQRKLTILGLFLP